jgi:hypothetical protein
VCDESLMHQQGIAVESQIALLLSQRLCGNKPFREGVVVRHRLCGFRRAEAIRHGVGAVCQQLTRRAVGGQGGAAKRVKTGFSSWQVESREQPLCRPRLGLVTVQEQIGADACIRCCNGCKKGSHSLPRIAGTGKRAQGVEQGGSRLRFVARAGQPFGAARHAIAHQCLGAGLTDIGKQADKGLRHLARGLALQTRGKGLPQFVEAARTVFGQCRAGEVGSERRHGNQLQEPAVEGVDRQPRLRGGQAFVQVARPGQRCRIVAWVCDSALGEKVDSFRGRRGSKETQPVENTLLNLARRLAREGDSQNFRWLSSGQQQADDARRQQPGLAAAGTGLNDGTARRIEHGMDARDFTRRRHDPSGTGRALRTTGRRRRRHVPAARHRHAGRRTPAPDARLVQ